MPSPSSVRRIALACCKVYVSESKNELTLRMLESAARIERQAPLVQVFQDKSYNRVAYTVTGLLPSADDEKEKAPPFLPGHLPIRAAVKAIVKAALDNVDLRDHRGSHPRLGAVDHISFHPLGSASLPHVASLARAVAEDISTDLAIPTFLYGAAHPQRRPLHVIRRRLGYFRHSGEGLWTGGCPDFPPDLQPDFGPAMAPPKSGVVVLGAVPWVVNFNVPIQTADLDIGRRIASRVRGRGGGLISVQAMALPHGDRVEVACNILNLEESSPKAVQELVAVLGEYEGVKVDSGYFTSYTEEEVFDVSVKQLLSHA